MGYASSAISTCGASRSASEKTATVAIPCSRQARITRTAISPRLAMSSFLMVVVTGRPRSYGTPGALGPRHAWRSLEPSQGVAQEGLVHDVLLGHRGLHE